MKELNQIYKIRSSEDSFRSSIRILIFLSQLFGVCPLPVPFGRHEKYANFGWKIARLIHQVWCAAIIVGILTSFYFQHVQNYTIAQYTQIKVLLRIGEYISIISTCIACVIGAQINRNVYEKYFQNLMEIDAKLIECGSRINGNNLGKFISKCIAISVLFEVVLVAAFAISYFYDENPTARNITLYVVPHMVVLLCIITYCSLLYAIRERCRNVTLMLKKISFDLLFKKEYRYTGNDTDSIQTASIEQIICQKLNCLRLTFLEISRLTADVSGRFGILFISILVSTFLILSTELFAFYEYIEQSAPDVYVPFLSVLWIIFYGTRIIFVLRMNHMVNIEVSFFLNNNIRSTRSLQLISCTQKCKLGCALYEINFYGFGLEDNVESCVRFEFLIR